jgi:hypothetical protein
VAIGGGGGGGGDDGSPSEFSAALISEFLRRTEAELLSWEQEDRDSLANKLMGRLSPQQMEDRDGLANQLIGSLQIQGRPIFTTTEKSN